MEIKVNDEYEHDLKLELQKIEDMFLSKTEKN